MAGNFVDSLFENLFPERALRRMAARKRMEMLDKATRNYEAAAHGRRTGGWWAPPSDADTLVAAQSRLLRDRSRDLVRNNPIAATIVAKHADYIVGNGIVPRANTGDPALNKQCDELFAEAAKYMHPERTMTFYGQQYQAVRTVIEGGEIFGRRRSRRKSDNLPVPVQIQLLEPEFIDSSKGSMENREIRDGIEFDRIGGRKGYWIFRQHPNALRPIPGLDMNSHFVPAQQVLHLYEPLRTQIRGVPWLAPVMNDIRDLGDYFSAEDLRKKVEACVVGVVIPGVDDVDPLVGVEETEIDPKDRSGLRDAYGNPHERMEPGMFLYAHGGQDVRFNNPAMTTGQESYIRTRLRNIAAGARMPYELMTGDFSQANFASGKLGILNYHRFVRLFQKHYLIPQFCQPAWDWVMEAAVLAGKLPMDKAFPCKWQPPEFDSITRLDDARADILEMRSGKRTLKQVIAATGNDPDTHLEEIAETNALLDDKGIILDSDPRTVTLNGQLQLDPQSDTNPGDSNA